MYFGLYDQKYYTLDDLKQYHQEQLATGQCTEIDFQTWLEVRLEMDFYPQNKEKNEKEMEL